MLQTELNWLIISFTLTSSYYVPNNKNTLKTTLLMHSKSPVSFNHKGIVRSKLISECNLGQIYAINA